MKSSYFVRKNFWVPIKQCETEISIKKVQYLYLLDY